MAAKPSFLINSKLCMKKHPEVEEDEGKTNDILNVFDRFW